MRDQVQVMRKDASKDHVIAPCNFRASGLLSNESTRHLRSMHDAFARTLAHSLDLFLGSPVEIKLVKIDQIGARELSATMTTGSYLVPFSLLPMQERVIAKFENGLLFPLLDLLLGGRGEPIEHIRELTEIDEELFRSVTELIAGQLERAWKVPAVSVSLLPSVKPVLTGQLFAMEERVVTLQFEIRLATAISEFALALPISFSSALVRSHTDAGRRSEAGGSARFRFRERLLRCDMPLSIDLAELTVPLGDLIGIEVGSLLNLRAPVQAPIQLRTGGHPIFEATPVRKGEYKAAQLHRALNGEG